jgi:hypothetical protein
MLSSEMLYWQLGRLQRKYDLAKADLAKALADAADLRDELTRLDKYRVLAEDMEQALD